MYGKYWPFWYPHTPESCPCVYWCVYVRFCVKITDAADDQALREHGTSADDHAAMGANEELKKWRAAAAVAWWKYEKAETRLEKVGIEARVRGHVFSLGRQSYILGTS
ncbi:unnamed protein product [Ectocarpus sp. 12 AP-2014]